MPHGLFLHIHPRKSFFIHCPAYFLLKSDCFWCMYIKHGELTWLDVQHPQHKLVEMCSQYKAGTSWYKDALHLFNPVISWLYGIKVLKYNIDLYYHTWLYNECQMIENVLLAHGYASLWMQKDDPFLSERNCFRSVELGVQFWYTGTSVSNRDNFLTLSTFWGFFLLYYTLICFEYWSNICVLTLFRASSIYSTSNNLFSEWWYLCKILSQSVHFHLLVNSF